MTATIDKVVRTAHDAGSPKDQIRNFLSTGYVPQPVQWQFHAAARAADRPSGPDRIALAGDRGGAKSHAIMAQVTLDDAQRRDGLNILYLRKIGKSAREALDQLRARIFINIPHTYSRHAGVIRFPNESKIIVGHFKDDRDIDAYLGIEFDLMVIEEAPQLSKSKVDQLLGSLRTSRQDWKPRAYLSGNPGGIGHQWFKSTFIVPMRRKAETRTKVIMMSWRDNIFVDPGYVNYLNSLTGVLGRMWRDGDFDVGAGQFFVNWDFDTHVMRPRDIPRHWPIWASLDYGFSHPTAVYWHTRYDGTIYTIAEHVQARWLVPQHATVIGEITTQIGTSIERLESFVAGSDVFARRDDTTGKTLAEQYLKQGIALQPANMNRIQGAAQMLARLGNPDAGIPATWKIFSNCVQLIQNLPNMLSDPKRPEDVLKIDADEAGVGGDDPYDAARYGLMQQQIINTGGFSATYK